MALPEKNINQVQTNPNDANTIYDIVPKMMTDSDGVYKAELPSLSADNTIALITDVNKKLDKLTYEWNKDVAMGSTGYIKIGSFPMYDTNITIHIDATTANTYHGTIVIATQNTSTSSMGSVHKADVYDDPTGTIASSLRIVWTNGSNNYDVYFVPQSWSKNVIHIQAVALATAPNESTICQKITSGSAPATTSGITITNILKTYTTTAPNSNSTDNEVPTAKAVWTAIDNLPEPMVFKGTLGTGGTITTLPVNGSATIGDTYKVITEATYAGQSAKVGDTFICDSKTSSANTWVLIPAGDELADIQINGTTIIDSNKIANIITESAYNKTTNKIATMTDIENAKVIIRRFV